MSLHTRIGWIRHGITEWNLLGKIQGITDIPLSAEGIRQAQLLAERLSKGTEKWDGIYCSDLQRAKLTAEILAERMELPVIVDARIRERSFGQAEGTTEPERLARWGEDWRRRVPDQESDAEIRSRGQHFLDELSDNHPGEAWLIVTHGSFLARMLQSLCTQLDDAHLKNVSLTILEQQQDGWKTLLHNCTNHLQNVTTSSND